MWPRGCGAPVPAASLALLGGVVGPTTWLLLDRVLRMPAPSWGVHLRDHSIEGIAAAVGGLVALASIPVARAAVRRIRRYDAARLGTLTEHVRDAAERE